MTIENRIRGGVVFVSLIVGPFAFAQEPMINSAKIKEFNQSIQKKGAKWVAKETWVSKLSRAEVKRMLGSNEVPDHELEFEALKSALPAAVDWRNQNGVNWLGEVLNQGNCGSCVAFSAIGTLEAQVTISSGLPWLHPNFSTEQLFACGGGSCDFGWFPSSAAKFLQSKGVVDGACAPYTMGSTGADVSCAQATCSSASARTYKISKVNRPTSYLGGSIESVKQALQKGPLMTSMRVYSDFLTYSGGIYQAVSKEMVGGHAVSIVGYDDATRSWLVRNSWGKDWGEGGFVRVSWDDRSGVGADTYQFELPSSPEYLSVQDPVENAYISGNYPVKLGTNSLGNIQIDVRAPGKRNAIVSLTCSQKGADECVSIFDTKGLPDGRYELVAKTGSDGSFSQPRSIYVVNQVPQNLSISFAGHNVDLTKPLKGRPEFDVTTSSMPVPLHSLTFVVKKDGKVITQRTTDVVLPQMRIGFRTNTVPNGEYEIQFTGELPAGGKTYTVESAPLKVSFQN